MDTNSALITKFIKSVDWDWLNHSGCFSEDDSYEVVECIDDNDFYCKDGVTKLVVIPQDKQALYVIKIPFTKMFSDDVYNEESNEYGDYVDLEGAPFGYGFDYCHAEKTLVELAGIAGVEEFFPATEIYQEIPFPVYLQERCITMYDYQSKTRSPEEIKKKTTTLKENASFNQISWLSTFSSNWILDAVDRYGEEKLFKLFDFLTFYNLSDFHRGNYGYTASDHRPVLIDFSGFNENY